MWGCVLTSLAHMQLSNFPSTTAEKTVFSPTVYSSLFCQRIIIYSCVGLFLDSPFCSIDPYVCLCSKFNYCNLDALPEVWEGYVSCFAVFTQDCLDNRRRQWHPTPVLLPGKIPWMEEPGGLKSMRLLRVRHDWATSISLFTFVCWSRNWQPTPVFLPGEAQGQRSLVGCRLWGRTESDTTEVI